MTTRIFEMKTRRRPQTPPEEIANGLCHGLAFLAIVAFYPALLTKALRHGPPHAAVGVSLLSLTLGLLYLCSTIHHILPRNETKRLFQRLDQTALFLAIPGSYAPFAITALRTSWDWTVFYAIWGLTLGGIAFRIYQGFRGTHFTTFLYVTLTVLNFAVLPSVFWHLPWHGIFWMLGCLSLYGIGILFFLAHHLPFRHLGWHLCAVAGSTCLFLAVYWYTC